MRCLQVLVGRHPHKIPLLVTKNKCVAVPESFTHHTHQPPVGYNLAHEARDHEASNQVQTSNCRIQDYNSSPVHPVTSIPRQEVDFSASLLMFKTVRNDSSLFLAARSAGLVRIRFNNLEHELERVQWEGTSIDSSLWWSMGTAGIDVWCDTCLKLL